jgi:hypothetical protein
MSSANANPVTLYQTAQAQSNIFANDGVQGVVAIPNTSIQWEGAGVFGGITNASTTTNGVAGRFYCLATGAGLNDAKRVKCWGVNALLSDGTAGTNYGYTHLANEWDYNINNALTKVVAHSIGGASTIQPASALGYTVNSLGGTGTSVKWDWGFGSLDGTATVGLQLGTLNTGNNTSSQPIFMFSRSGDGTSYLAQIQGDALGNLDIVAPTTVNFTANGVSGVFTIAGAKVSSAAPIVPPSYDVDSLPSAAAASGGIVICTACTAGSTPCTAGAANVMARSTGTQWNCGSF